MLLAASRVPLDALARETGWIAKPEGLCKGDRCIPLPTDAITGDPATVDVGVIAERLRMGLVVDESRGLWALGPEAGGHVITTAEAPELELPDMVSGTTFRLSSLRGKKVVLLAWSSW
jgi:hypothetical protein